MPKPQPSALEGRRLMVVEDDYMIANDIRCKLEQLGARVLGPVPSAARALKLIGSGQEIDGATLDVRLGSENAFPVADALRARGVPFVFVTGDRDWDLPAVYGDVPFCRKPVDIRMLLSAFSR